jgi:hypothetical protein
MTQPTMTPLELDRLRYMKITKFHLDINNYVFKYHMIYTYLYRVYFNFTDTNINYLRLDPSDFIITGMKRNVDQHIKRTFNQ